MHISVYPFKGNGNTYRSSRFAVLVGSNCHEKGGPRLGPRTTTMKGL